MGKPENVGKCFAITHKWVRDNIQSTMQGLIMLLPRPDYEHRIYHDTISDYLIVARPKAYGDFAHCKRLC